MSNGDAWTNDDLNVVIPERVAKTPPTSFYLDDAFSDADDHESTFDFSSASIRAELAKNLSISLDESDEFDDSQTDKSPASGAPDDSVSTLDINGHGARSPSQSTSYSGFADSRSPPDIYASPPALDTRQLSSQFDQISLGSPHVELTDQTLNQDRAGEPTSPVDDGTDDTQINLEGEEDHGHDHDPEADAYPVVHIDASEPHPVPVEIPPRSSLAEDAVHLDVPNRVSHEEPKTPSASGPTQKSVSTPSLPIPSSTPSSVAAAASSARQDHLFCLQKSRAEDKKHMADWEKMMKQSRVAEEKRRKALNERRLARELKVEESLHIWEREILPDWRVVNEIPALRKLWWAGIPTNLRAVLWERAVGNALALSKDSYRTCLARAKRALAAGTFPTTTLSLIERDVSKTLPSLHIFHSEMGPMYQDLKDMLYAWVVARSDEGLGYVLGIARVAAMILLNMPPVQGFIVMRNLLERHCMRSFYGGLATKEDVEAYYRIFDTLLADGMPKIYFNFKQHQISPSAYLPEWIVPMFLDHLPFDACARVWDVILLEGDSFLYRASLAILAVLEPRLFFPDRKELLELLRGENRAALEVASRDGNPLNGGKYEIYGVDEETLWDRIDAMDDWWKESTWTRLLQRELPDL
ncbi:hypothetical protein EW146_g6750 [Bondarzewia mesenterica]|uniref:Rab-GAP TBC domain-containing protein n=1 Tax=Bondarzewia mesenterica TaxID=1095465 RepID=A0A4S4LPH8_9AGAM|nr:hypothetical protein EW146_g6750 [Bondarzewia mesenterica]